jgi:acetyltransferase
MVSQLNDGTVVRLRPIRSDDKALLSDGIAHLSDETVHRRFLSPKRHFTAAELRYLTEVDGHDHVALVAEDPREPGPLLGVGRFVRLAEDPEAAEIAILVADPFQGQGLGSLLGAELARAAAAEGVRRFTATMLADNRPAQALMAKLTGHLERHHVGRGATELVAPLAA